MRKESKYRLLANSTIKLCIYVINYTPGWNRYYACWHRCDSHKDGPSGWKIVTGATPKEAIGKVRLDLAELQNPQIRMVRLRLGGYL
jgi:hypothetical protein